MSQDADTAVKRNLTYLFAGLFGLFAVLIVIARVIVY